MTSQLGALLADHIRQNGLPSIRAAARRAGTDHQVLSAWISGKRQPRPKLFYRVLERLGVPLEGFRDLVPAPPLCKFCGTPAGHSTWGLLRVQNRLEGEFVHRTCQAAARGDWRLVRCIGCSRSLWLPQWRIDQLKWKQEHHGILYRYCRGCSARQRADHHRLFEGTLRKHGKGSFNLEALMKRYAHGDPAAVAEVHAQLRTRLRRIVPAAWNKAAERPMQAVVRVVKGSLQPLFRRCARCPLLVYITELSRPGPRSLFHPQCWCLFQKTRVYRRWRGQRAKGIDAAFPLPKVPRTRGRPVDTPERLLFRYHLLMRTAAPPARGGKSRAQLAKELGTSRRALGEGIDAFVELLPGSWDLVFQGKTWRHSNRVRQQLFPSPPTAATGAISSFA